MLEDGLFMDLVNLINHSLGSLIHPGDGSAETVAFPVEIHLSMHLAGDAHADNAVPQTAVPLEEFLRYPAEAVPPILGSLLSIVRPRR